MFQKSYIPMQASQQADIGVSKERNHKGNIRGTKHTVKPPRQNKSQVKKSRSPKKPRSPLLQTQYNWQQQFCFKTYWVTFIVNINWTNKNSFLSFKYSWNKMKYYMKNLNSEL